MSAVTLEICIDGADGLIAAVAGGADRIELCSALALGGLTPSPGLMTLAARAPVPVYAMIRPRAGDFVFSPAEIDQMRREIDAAREAGLAGVVLGASEPGGALDEALLARLAAHAEGLGRTLHRAFDLVPDRAAALETAVALGFERILTSGGAAKAGDALPELAALVKQAAARISVMPGSGVRPDNAAAIIAATGTTAGTMIENTGRSGKKRATNRKSTGTATITTGIVTITGTDTAPATATTTVCRRSIG